MTESDAILDLLEEHAPGLAEWYEAQLEWMALAEPQVHLAGESLRRGDILAKRDGYHWRWTIPEPAGAIVGVSAHDCEKHAEVYVSRYPPRLPLGEPLTLSAFAGWNAAHADPIGDMLELQRRILEGTIGPR